MTTTDNDFVMTAQDVQVLNESKDLIVGEIGSTLKASDYF